MSGTSENHPAQGLTRFYWPVSDGTTRAALTLTRTSDGTLVAQVVGMARGEVDAAGECRFVPVVFAELPVPQTSV